ncbi:accessory gene regulator B family protein, partial [Staphylococcus aureus]|uniref:accessory gene regulator B family protein n=1 Tax=Staphylococcus aureus TaxID=1280 RepID=UPI000B31882C
RKNVGKTAFSFRHFPTFYNRHLHSVYAPAATKKKPIPVRLIKRKKYYAIIVSLTFFIITLIIKEPFAQFIQLGIIIEAITLLPIFFIKEDLK